MGRASWPNGDVMRAGITELLQTVNSSTQALSSNLPSENYHFGRGSKRIEGTGKTAAVKAKRDAKEGKEAEEKGGERATSS